MATRKLNWVDLSDGPAPIACKEHASGVHVHASCTLRSGAFLRLSEGCLVDYLPGKGHSGALVNAANRWCQGGGGVDGAVADAGGVALRLLRAALPPVIPGEPDRCFTGDAVTTGPATDGGQIGQLHTEYVIHAAGPDYSEQLSEAESDGLLRSAHLSAMREARVRGVASLAFAMLSASIYRGDRSLRGVIDIGLRAIEEGGYEGLLEWHLVAHAREEVRPMLSAAAALFGGKTGSETAADGGGGGSCSGGGGELDDVGGEGGGVSGGGGDSITSKRTKDEEGTPWECAACTFRHISRLGCLRDSCSMCGCMRRSGDDTPSPSTPAKRRRGAAVAPSAGSITSSAGGSHSAPIDLSGGSDLAAALAAGLQPIALTIDLFLGELEDGGGGSSGGGGGGGGGDSSGGGGGGGNSSGTGGTELENGTTLAHTLQQPFDSATGHSLSDLCPARASRGPQRYARQRCRAGAPAADRRRLSRSRCRRHRRR